MSWTKRLHYDGICGERVVRRDGSIRFARAMWRPLHDPSRYPSGCRVLVARWGGGRMAWSCTDIDAVWELQEAPKEAD
jgi:hypothetical protein